MGAKTSLGRSVLSAAALAHQNGISRPLLEFFFLLFSCTLRTIRMALVFWSPGNLCRVVLMRHLSAITQSILFPLLSPDSEIRLSKLFFFPPPLQLKANIPCSVQKRQRQNPFVAYGLNVSVVSVADRSRLCWVGLDRGEPAGEEPRGRRRQDLLFLQRGGERVRLLWQHHRLADRSRVQGKARECRTTLKKTNKQKTDCL